jgi:S-DNA-T family DNA segregation ATPase FtsK/SpoIIIE
VIIPGLAPAWRDEKAAACPLQRSLGIGYGRAARLIDFMAEDGIVGAYNGSSAREVTISPEEWLQMKERKQLART